MFEPVDSITWSVLAQPYGHAERALGRLAHGLETSPLHATWLWREITRVSVTIAQAGGYQATLDPLRHALIGVPLAAADNTPGLAAAKRVFLASAPLFRAKLQADSDLGAWPRFWGRHDRIPSDDGTDAVRGGEGEQEQDRLRGLVRALAGLADDGRRPALINLLVDLRRQAAARCLAPSLARIALPLALVEAGLVPRAAPGLLGGRRLPLGFSRAAVSAQPLNDWLAAALEALAQEADQSYRRLSALAVQHRAWCGVLNRQGLRSHARVPQALDLLAATPVVTISLVARHLRCSHVAAGQAIARLVDWGILIEPTSRARHKIFIAGDLPAEAGGDVGHMASLAVSAPPRPVDVDALQATLDGVLADLDRQTARARTRLSEGAG